MSVAYDAAVEIIDDEVHKTCEYPSYSRLRDAVDALENENDDMREVIVRMHGLLLEKCEAPHDQYHGKPCESCAEAGTDDCPKVISRQLRELGIEVDDGR